MVLSGKLGFGLLVSILVLCVMLRVLLGMLRDLWFVHMVLVYCLGWVVGFLLWCFWGLICARVFGLLFRLIWGGCGW